MKGKIRRAFDLLRRREPSLLMWAAIILLAILMFWRQP